MIKIKPIVSGLVKQVGVYPVCILCEQLLTDYQRICQNCVMQLPWTEDYCQHCAQPLAKGYTQCGDCQKNPPPFNRLWVALDYVFPIDKLVRQGKFSHRLNALALLAELFIKYKDQSLMQKPAVLIPVPLHAQRLRWRGFNQALLLARLMGQYWQIPIDFHSIKRTKMTKAQTSLSAKQRAENVDQAFILTRPITYPRVVLVDDVWTTGNTIRALSHVLRAAGVMDIDIYCIARTRR